MLEFWNLVPSRMKASEKIKEKPLVKQGYYLHAVSGQIMDQSKENRRQRREGSCSLPPFRWCHLLIHMSLFCRQLGPGEMMAMLSYAKMEQIASKMNELMSRNYFAESGTWGTLQKCWLVCLMWDESCSCWGSRCGIPAVCGMAVLQKICPPRTRDCDLLRKKGLCSCNQTKDLEVRSSWVIDLVPNPTAGGFKNDPEEPTMSLMMEGEVGMIPAQECQRLRQPPGAKTWLSLRTKGMS